VLIRVLDRMITGMISKRPPMTITPAREHSNRVSRKLIGPRFEVIE